MSERAALRSGHAIIASGSGRYGDPWHPFAATSDRLAGVLRDVGFTVSVDDDVDRAVRASVDADLLVVNAGDPWRGGRRQPVPGRSIDALSRAIDNGVGILSLHAGVASLRDYPEWGVAVGAVWLPGVSGHPPFGPTIVTPSAAGPVTTLGFELLDERYCRLQRLGGSTVVAWHEGEGVPEPAVWLRRHRSARVAVDVLGHDERSFDSADHRQLLGSLAQWAARRR